MAPKRKRGTGAAPKRPAPKQRQTATSSARNGESNTAGDAAPAANVGPVSRRTRARAATVEPVEDPEAILRKPKRRRVTPAPDPAPSPPPPPAASPPPPPPPVQAAVPAPISKTGGLPPRRRYARAPPSWQIDEVAGATPTVGTKPAVFPSSSPRPGTKPGVMPAAMVQQLQAQRSAPATASSSSPSSSSSPPPAPSSSPAGVAAPAAPVRAPEIVQQQTPRISLVQRDTFLYRTSISTQVTYLNTPTELKLVLEIRTCPTGYRSRLQYHGSLFLQNTTLDNVYIGYISGSRLSKPSQNRPHVDSRRWVQEWWNGDVVNLPDSCNSMAKSLRVLYEQVGDDSAEPCYESLSDEHSRQLSDNGNEIVYISNIHISPNYARNGLGGVALDQYYRLLMGQALPAWYAFNGPVTFLLMPGLICDIEVTRFWSRMFPEIDYNSPLGEWAMIDAVSTYLIAWYERRGYETFINRGVFEDGAGVVIVRGILGRQVSPMEFMAGNNANPGSNDDGNLPIPPPGINTSPPMRNAGDSSSSGTSGGGGDSGRADTSGQRGRQAHTPASPTPAKQPQSSSSGRASSEGSKLPEESFLDDTLFGDRALYGDNPPPPAEEAETIEAEAGTQDNSDVFAIAHIAGTTIEEQQAIDAAIASSLAQSAPRQGPQPPEDEDNDSATSSEKSIEDLSYQEQLALVMQRSLQDVSSSAQDPAQPAEQIQDEEMSDDAPEAQAEQQQQQPEARVAHGEGMEISTEDFLARTKPWIAPNARRREE